MEILRVATPGELKEQSNHHLDDFTAFVKSAGEADASHVKTAKCLVQLYRSERLVGTAALKANSSYRNSCFKSAGVEELADSFPLELGYVAVDKELRRRGVSHLLVAAALSRREKSGVYATSNLVNLPMHKVLETRGFTRAGVPWESKKKPGQYLALFLSTGGP
jgi:GNAT superfamily N-acetyltransferase